MKTDFELSKEAELDLVHDLANAMGKTAAEHIKGSDELRRCMEAGYVDMIVARSAIRVAMAAMSHYDAEVRMHIFGSLTFELAMMLNEQIKDESQPTSDTEH